ncbi:MAG: TlpA family protein disulfide reductase [Armatimonadetes bacterium]|nr:TlpA family protein disulfide reductase [Armatimonadota bacterium]
MNQPRRAGRAIAATLCLLSAGTLWGCNPEPTAPDAASPEAASNPTTEVTSAPATEPEIVSTSPTGLVKLKNPPPAEPFGDLTAISGEKVSLTSLKGKVIVLDFWATWCGPCRMTIPILSELQEKYGKDGLVVVGISDESEAEVKPFAEQMSMKYTVVADTKNNDVWQQAYGVDSLPTLAVIDRKGKVRLYEKGVDPTPGKGTEDRLKELLPQLLVEK